jgi:hypothetical protein
MTMKATDTVTMHVEGIYKIPREEGAANPRDYPQSIKKYLEFQDTV